MNPLPESAVELAARDICAVAWPTIPFDSLDPPTQDFMRQMARAALPAIREAVVGEYRELVEAAIQEAKDLSPHSDTIDSCSHRDPFEAYHMGFKDCHEAVQEALATLQEARHDG